MKCKKNKPLTHQKVVAKLIFSHTIVVCQLSDKMVILWTEANHCLAPFPIIGAAQVRGEGRVTNSCSTQAEFKVQLSRELCLIYPLQVALQPSSNSSCRKT